MSARMQPEERPLKKGQRRWIASIGVCAALGIVGLVGIVSHDWTTREAFDELDPVVELISTGKRVDVKEHVQPGGYTLIEFIGSWSAESRKLGRRLNKVLPKHPNLRVRVVDIGSLESEVAKQYEIQRVPTLWLYRDGQLVTDVTVDVWKTLEGKR
jgi:hypothetical protein